MSAKELGQIHSVSYSVNQQPGTNMQDHRFDLPGSLCDKMQRLVRQGQYFKIVGIDMAISPNLQAPGNGGTISGQFRYYKPTRGRCAAYRHAFKSMADQMKMQGIAMRENKGYDFRVALTNNAGVTPTFKNQATLDGVNGLALYDTSNPGASVFEVYNKSVLPNLTNTPAADLFAEGFDTLLQSGVKTDFVKNDADIWSGNEGYADETYDSIPFQIEFNDGVSATATFQWRPDPALYVACMTGNFELFVDQCAVTGTATSIDCDITFYVSGWKSIMGNPDKKKRSSKKRRKGRK